MAIANFIEKLAWRYAVKAFDTTRSLDDTTVEQLLEATRLAPTAFGQQPFKIILVKNQATRDALAAVSNGQMKVANASHLVVFAVQTNLGDQTADENVALVSETRHIPVEKLEGLSNMVKGIYKQRSPEALIAWAKCQAFLALGVLVSACALESVDACPMEGFDAAKYDEILGLKEQNLASVVIVTLGYRSAEDGFQYFKKVRKAYSDFVRVV